MEKTVISLLLCVMAITSLHLSPAIALDVELKGLGRFDGWRDNALVGYGLVVGLPGTGDTRNSEITQQTLKNVLNRLGLTVTEEQINSRNVAVVLVSATLPASANVGDRISVTVASAGDARSLAGGTLLMTPLQGPNRKVYALAQGPLVTGGYSFESQLNRRQRNFPTTAIVEQGATVETPVSVDLVREDGSIGFMLREPSFTTAQRVAVAINTRFGERLATAIGADEVSIIYTGQQDQVIEFLAELENISVDPDMRPRIIINERTGTIVAGGDVTISSVVVSQGDIKVSVNSENYASQPEVIAGINPGINSLIVTNTDIEVEQGVGDVVASFPNSTVTDLVEALSAAGVDTRRLISILQAMKAAGAIQADLVVQ